MHIGKGEPERATKHFSTKFIFFQISSFRMVKRQKLKGALLGYAIGDTLGKGTEFMEVPEIRRRYPSGLRRYSDIFQDAHRSQWEPGEWTNDTETMLNMAKAIISDNGALLVRHQAKVLHEWYQGNPVDVVANVRWVLSHPGYLEHPLETCARVWDEMEHQDPSNEALGRSILAALAPGNPETNARTTCLLTNSDTRCEGTAAILGRIAHDLLHHDKMTPRTNIMEIAVKIDARIIPYLKAAFSGKLSDFELDDPCTLSDTRKAAGSALWALYHCKDAADALYKLVDAGGDSDTNAALGVLLVSLRDGGDLNMEEHLMTELTGYDEIHHVADALADAWGFER